MSTPHETSIIQDALAKAKLGRKPNTTPVSKEIMVDAIAIGQTMDAANSLAVIQRNKQEVLTQAEQEKDEVLAAGIDIGRLEALDFVATVANAAILPIYENVKKSKAWRFLRNPNSSNGSNFESLEEFCQVKLGKTYGRLQHLIGNRNLIGQDAFEQAERLGLRQVDYNAIKGLPAPDQELVRRAVEEAKSRDEVLDLLQELAARHATEKATFAKQADEAKKEHAATNKRLEVVTKQKETAEAKAARIAVMPPDESLADLQKEASKVMNNALGAIKGGLRAALQALNDVPSGAPNQAVFMAGLVGQVAAELAALREEFNLPDVSNAADAALAADVAQWAS